MIFASLYLAALGPIPQDPAQAISKMFAYYHDAKSLSGTIKMTQGFQNRTAVVDTQFQFEWPAKIFIKQQMTSPKGQDRWLVTGDGVGFTYDAPRIVGEGSTNTRLYEPVQYIPPPPKYKADVQMPTPPPHDVRTIYRAVCLSLGDRSVPMDIAFGRKEDLGFIRGQIAGLNDGGQQDLNGFKCQVVKGLWKTNPNSTETVGEYEFWITESGELKRFATSEEVTFGSNQEVTLRDNTRTRVAQKGVVVTVWDVNIKKDSGVDPALFKVVLKY